MIKEPKKFCEFQREYDPNYKKFVCGIYDWQCSKPICSYESKSKMKKNGCDIARVEGQRIKQLLGDPNANPPEIAKNFDIRFRDEGLIDCIAPESEQPKSPL
jgi:hypothetical protein